ncbi:MAG TPA: ABC transporter permease [Acidimicrobiia bacterium]|nr:ABC transporter permease [Acidimicrobiia bacterium]
MSFIGDVLSQALQLLSQFGAELREVLWLTLMVSLVATAIGVVVGVPLGTALGLGRFRGRTPLLVAVNTGMGMPPVLAGLLILLLLWSDGPLGSFGILFTPQAMVLAQSLLAIPIAAGVTAGAVGGLSPVAREQLTALGLRRTSAGWIAVREAWPGVAAAVAAAFGRVVSEVGAVLVVGGNIQGETRVLTTAIVEEARQAQFGAALALGIVLMVLALVINGGLTWLQLRERAR